MREDSEPSRPPPVSPCTKVCTLDAAGYCIGCLRTGAEIGRWSTMTPTEQWNLIAELEARRRALDGAARVGAVSKSL
ncbi:MAG TPA: DUF1289 domain-containing protein [Steroidobacteraceae bacterium]|nr:DUF1289 domain-containing protein [Steroidobacteraceae bacterium]